MGISEISGSSFLCFNIIGIMDNRTSGAKTVPREEKNFEEHTFEIDFLLKRVYNTRNSKKLHFVIFL